MFFRACGAPLAVTARDGAALEVREVETTEVLRRAQALGGAALGASAPEVVGDAPEVRAFGHVAAESEGFAVLRTLAALGVDHASELPVEAALAFFLAGA